MSMRTVSKYSFPIRSFIFWFSKFQPFFRYSTHCIIHFLHENPCFFLFNMLILPTFITVPFPFPLTKNSVSICLPNTKIDLFRKSDGFIVDFHHQFRSVSNREKKQNERGTGCLPPHSHFILDGFWLVFDRFPVRFSIVSAVF